MRLRVRVRANVRVQVKVRSRVMVGDRLEGVRGLRFRLELRLRLEERGDWLSDNHTRKQSLKAKCSALIRKL